MKAMSPLTGVQVLDAPNDDGGRLVCIWDRPDVMPTDGVYRIFISDSIYGPFYLVGEQKSNGGYQSDAPDLFGFQNQCRLATCLHGSFLGMCMMCGVDTGSGWVHKKE